MAKESQKGVSLIMTFFIMIIILSVVLSVSALLYKEIKVLRNVSSSVSAFYSADSGVEKMLFFHRQMAPTGAKSGLCKMFDACPEPDSPTRDLSIYCKNFQITYSTACQPDAICNNCEVSFATNFSGNENDRNYKIEAKVSPDADPSKEDPDLNISSKGIYQGAQRKMDILIIPTQ